MPVVRKAQRRTQNAMVRAVRGTATYFGRLEYQSNERIAMNTRRKIVLGAGTLVVAGAGLFAWQRPQERPKLRVGYVPLADCASLVKAQADGRFAAEGLDVELVPLQSGGRILEAIASKSLDIGISNLVTVLMARSRGIDYRIVSGATIERKTQPLNAILVREKSNIQKLSDLRGRRVAVSVLKSVNELVLTSIADQQGFGIRDISFIEVPLPQMIGILENQTVDAIVAIEPYVSHAVKQFGARVLAHHIVDQFGDSPVAAYVADGTSAVELRRKLTGFRRAMEQAAAELNADANAVRALIPTFTKLTPDLVSQMNLPFFQTSLPTTVPATMADLMVKHNWITQDQRPKVLKDLILIS
jgi:NitT/TauT family transport system substrate-binding protein